MFLFHSNTIEWTPREDTPHMELWAIIRALVQEVSVHIFADDIQPFRTFIGKNDIVPFEINMHQTPCSAPFSDFCLFTVCNSHRSCSLETSIVPFSIFTPYSSFFEKAKNTHCITLTITCCEYLLKHQSI